MTNKESQQKQTGPTETKDETQQTTTIFEQIKKDRRFRQELAKASHYWFIKMYLPHHLTYPLAVFHKQMLAITEDPSCQLVNMIAFRGSGKTTIMNLSNVIWSIVGKPQKKLVLILSQHKKQAKIHLENIKYELETNELLKNDFGCFRQDREDWGPNRILLKKYGAMIMAAGTQQNIRGLKFGSHRPDLIICDDMEDGQSVQKHKEHKQMCEWFKNEVLTIGDRSTNIVVLGNLLENSSFIMKLRKEILQNRIANAVFCIYPLLDDNDLNLWPEKFKPEDVEKLKKSCSDESIWLREYLLVTGRRSRGFVPPATYEKYLGQYLSPEEQAERAENNINTGFCISAPDSSKIVGPNGELITVEEWDRLHKRLESDTKKMREYFDDLDKEGGIISKPWPPPKNDDPTNE